MPRRSTPRDPEQVRKIVRLLRERYISPEAQAVAEREFRKLQFQFPGLSLDDVMGNMMDPEINPPAEPTAEEIEAQERRMQEANQMALLDALRDAPEEDPDDQVEAEAAAIMAALKGRSGQSPGDALKDALNASSPVAGGDAAPRAEEPLQAGDGETFSTEEQDRARRILSALKSRNKPRLN